MRDPLILDFGAGLLAVRAEPLGQDGWLRVFRLARPQAPWAHAGVDADAHPDGDAPDCGEEALRLIFSDHASLSVVLERLQRLSRSFLWKCSGCGTALDAAGRRCAPCAATDSERCAEAGSAAWMTAAHRRFVAGLDDALPTPAERVEIAEGAAKYWRSAAEKWRRKVDELRLEQARRFDCRAPESGPVCGGCTNCLLRALEVATRERDEAQKLAALRYEEGALVLPVPERVGLEETPRGTMDLVPDEAVVADADVERDEAARLMRAQAEGKLQAVLYFQLARGRMSSTPCLVVAGGRHLRITMTPLAVSLQRDGREALRLFTERGAVIMPQGRPELTIASKFLIFDGEAADRPAIEEALAGLLPRAGACYQQALTRRPDLVGRLILAMELDREGRATEVRPEVDAAGDAGLLRCLREVFTDLRVPRLRRPGHLSVPILLQRVAGR